MILIQKYPITLDFEIINVKQTNKHDKTRLKPY